MKHQNDGRESPWCFIQGSVWRWRGTDSPAVQQGGLFLGVSHLTAASTTLPTPWHTLGMQGAPPARAKRCCCSRLLTNGPSQTPSKAAFQVMLFVQGREELLSLVAECDSHLQRLEVFVKGAGEASEAKRRFQEERAPCAPRHSEMKGSRLCCIASCCSPSNCTPFARQSPSTA